MGCFGRNRRECIGAGKRDPRKVELPWVSPYHCAGSPRVLVHTERSSSGGVWRKCLAALSSIPEPYSRCDDRPVFGITPHHPGRLLNLVIGDLLPTNRLVPCEPLLRLRVCFQPLVSAPLTTGSRFLWRVGIGQTDLGRRGRCRRVVGRRNRVRGIGSEQEPVV